VFLEAYVQAAARLAYMRQITCVTYQLVESLFTVGRIVGVYGRFNKFGYGVAAFICYPDVCVPEYVIDLAYLRGNGCECCPFLVYAVVRCGVFYVLSDVLVYVLLWVGNNFVGRCEGLLKILFLVVLF